MSAYSEWRCGALSDEEFQQWGVSFNAAEKHIRVGSKLSVVMSMKNVWDALVMIAPGVPSAIKIIIVIIFVSTNKTVKDPKGGI